MRSSQTPAPDQPARKILGLRAAALLEIVLFLGTALLVDRLVFGADRFATVSPHPFWIIVLLTAVQYGTNEALAATALASVALLAGAVPEQGFSEDLYDWLLRVSYNPVLWCIAAILLGEIRSGHRRRTEALKVSLAEAQKQADAIADAYEDLWQLKANLEVLVAGQLRTVRAMYEAAKAIERQSIGEVLIGIAQLVRSVINPSKFSIFLLSDPVLEGAICEGWTPDDSFQREFAACSPLFAAVVRDHRFVVVSNQGDEAILQGEGLLAGPLVSEQTGEVIGMLKIEDMPFLEFTPAGVQNFRILCEWIGTAIAHAQCFERLRDERAPVPSLQAG